MAIYIAGGTVDNINILFVNKDDGSFQGSENYEEAKKCLPNYSENHSRSYESSMSACIHWMSFNPKIYRFESIQEMAKILDGDTFKRYSNISGSVYGVPLKSDYEPEIVGQGKLI
jgi:hypothetical protein